jgi:P27 family predicted phage terminase small subunit
MKGRKPAAKRQMTDPQSTGETGFITEWPPAWLAPYAQEAWEATVRDLAASGRRIPLAYAGMFTTYCQAVGAAREADEVLSLGGLTCDGGRQGLRRHPCVVIRATAWQTVRASAESLGLTPGSAGRLQPAPIKKPSKFDDL